MRIAIGGIGHETNTFTDLYTTLDDFAVVEGEEILTVPPVVQDSSLQGIIEVCRESGNVELIPSLFAWALPSGVIKRDVYESLKQRLLAGISQAGRLDAVLLSMHGSMFVEEVGDADGDLLAAMRDLVGEDVQIFCALDLHATITDKMIENANAFVGYRTAPHIDKVETGRKTAQLALQAVAKLPPLQMTWVSVPMLVSGEQSETDTAPTSEIMAELIEPSAGSILTTSIFVGFPWADVEYGCMSALAVTTAADAEEGYAEASRLGQLLWDKREEFVFSTEAHELDRCLDIAEGEERGPIVISDGGDNPTAGSSQDLSNVLRTLVERKFKKALVAVIVDEQSYEKCAAAGVGGSVELALGRVNPLTEPARPFATKAIVKHIGVASGIPAAVIRIDGVDAILSTGRTAVYDPGFLTELNLDPLSYQTIVVKSGYLSPEYKALTHRPLLALTPGDTNLIIESLPFEKVKRPIYPLDKDFEWKGQ